VRASETAKLVAIMSEAFPQAPLGPGTSEVYETMLRDIDFDHGMLAVQRLIATSKWMPQVSEIRATVAEIKYGPPRSGVEAWGVVCEAIRRVGQYKPAPRFRDEKVAECVRRMGWLSLCLCTNEPADRARFVEIYEDLQRKERANLQAGYELPRPQAVASLPSAQSFGLVLRRMPGT
jgi:hypothetical protein